MIDLTETNDTSPIIEPPSTVPAPLSEKLFYEREELVDKLARLSAFIAGPKIVDIEREEIERLRGQETAMKHYAEILEARIKYHEAKEQQA